MKNNTVEPTNDYRKLCS